MAQEVGVAYYSLLPSGKGFGKAVEKDLNEAAAGHEKTQKSLWGKVVKYGSLAATAIGAVFTGKILSGGLSRALNIEDAQAKLKGLGHDTQAVTGIMQDALAAVRGTAFGLDQAATIAASAVAAGIEPGKQLERYLRLTADAASIAGGELSDLGRVFNNVTTVGAAYNDSLLVLAEKGLPIYQWLAEEMGVSTEAVKKLASEGKVSSEIFLNAIEKNIAGAALASGDTTRGAFANMQAAMSRWGASLLSGVLPFAKSFFSEMIVIFDGLNERSAPFIERFNEWLSGIDIEGAGQRFLDWMDNLDFSTLKETLTALSPLLTLARALGPVLVDLLAPALIALKDGLSEVLPQVATALTDAIIDLSPSLVELLAAIVPLVPDLVDLAVRALPLFIDALKAAIPVVEWLASELGSVFDALGIITDFLVGDLDTYGDYAEAVRGVGGAFGDTLHGWLDWFEGSSAALGGLVESVTSFFSDVQTFALGTVQFLKDTWAGLGQSIGDVLKIVIGLVTGNNDLVEESYRSLRDRLGGIWESVTSTVGNALSLIGSQVQQAVQRFLLWVGQIPRQVGAFFEGLPAHFVKVGRDIVKGLADGLTLGAKGAVSAIQNLGANMLTALKNWLGIRSPSRVFRDQVGKQIAAGVIAGIDGMQVQTATAVRSLVEVPQLAGAGAARFPSQVTLVDSRGSLLGLMDVRIGRYDRDQAVALDNGWSD